MNGTLDRTGQLWNNHNGCIIILVSRNFFVSESYSGFWLCHSSVTFEGTFEDNIFIRDLVYHKYDVIL